MKKIIRKEVRWESTRNRTYSVIQCEDCGRLTYERTQKRVQKALERACIHCTGQDRPERVKRLQASYRQDSRRSHPLYKSYQMMMARCFNPNHKSYSYYGGRGITVCTRWIVDFWAFVEDMGERPEGMTLDRIDGDGNYDPLNCKWSTHSEQMSNRNYHRNSLLTDEERKQMNAAKNLIRLRKNYVPTGRPVGRPRKNS